MKHRPLFQVILVVAVLLLAAGPGDAQEIDTADSESLAPEATLGTAFTYQGQLVYNGAPVNDTCEFTFSLWDGTGSGSTQIGSDVLRTGVSVSDGLFTVLLDFGADVFNGDARWLEIEVNCGEGAATLDPRQPLTPAPYALYAPPHNTLVAADGDPVDAVYVDNDGHVGIGTTSTSEKLTVAGRVESTKNGFKFPDGTIQTTAASGSVGDIKQLVQDFVVASGESVDAGDVVQFLDGYVQKNRGEYVFNRATTSDISVVVLSSNQFVVAYQDQTNSNYGTAVIGDVSGATITYSSEYVFNAASTRTISAATLSDTRFVVAYRDYGNSSYGTAVIGEVSGNTITYGSEYVFNNAETRYISIAALSSTQFVVAYQDVGNSEYGTAVIGDVSGSTVTYGSEYVFNSADTSYISVSAFSDTNFAMAYRDGDISGYGYGTAVIGDVSGTTITYGSEYVFNSANTLMISVASLSSTQFVVAYMDQGNSNSGTAIIGEVSGTTISYGSEYVFNAAETSKISSATFSSNQFVVAFQDDGNASFGTAVIGDISGTIITYGSAHVFNNAETRYISVAALSPTQFVVAYMDVGNVNRGSAVISPQGYAIGIARESKTEGQSVPVIITGVSDVHWGLTSGEIYYSDTSGGLSATDAYQRIGLAISATELLLDIDTYGD